MRKTVLTLTLALLATVTSMSAASGSETTPAIETNDSFVVGINSFCKAIMEGDIETVKRMIELGEDVNKKSLGMTPAIFAARYNKAEILKVLIENGADLDRKCDKGWTAQKHAELSNAQDALEVLRENI